MFRALFRVFDYSGRSTRWEYWSFFLGLIVLSFLGGIGLAAYRDAHAGLMPSPSDDASAWAAIAIFALLILPLIALKVRRYHDFGWSGWAVLLLAIPVVNIVMELMLLFRGPVAAAAPAYAPPPVTIYNTAGVAAPGGGHAAHVEQIARLADMHAQGALTAREFAAAKAKILRS